MSDHPLNSLKQLRAILRSDAEYAMHQGESSPEQLVESLLERERGAIVRGLVAIMTEELEAPYYERREEIRLLSETLGVPAWFRSRLTTRSQKRVTRPPSSSIASARKDTEHAPKGSIKSASACGGSLTNIRESLRAKPRNLAMESSRNNQRWYRLRRNGSEFCVSC